MGDRGTTKPSGRNDEDERAVVSGNKEVGTDQKKRTGHSRRNDWQRASLFCGLRLQRLYWSLLNLGRHNSR